MKYSMDGSAFVCISGNCDMISLIIFATDIYQYVIITIGCFQFTDVCVYCNCEECVSRCHCSLSDTVKSTLSILCTVSGWIGKNSASN